MLAWLALSAVAGPASDDAMVKAAARALPAVAYVEVKKGASWALGIQELFRANSLDAPPLGEPEGRATGSAVIVSADGAVVTNHHVVDAALGVTVVLADQRRFDATVVGTDPRSDLALLQIDGPGPFPWLPFSSRPVRVGETVMAVGSPFDFQSTITVGIVSATGRRGLEKGEIQDFIQTDAAVNPGNSGGPLVDTRGRIVGINTAIYSQGADQNSGVSFAIPAPMAQRVIQALRTGRTVPRARIGLGVRDAEEVDGDPSRRGAAVSWVLPAGPAAVSGLRRGDVIVAVDGEPVPSASALRYLIRSRAVGQQVSMSVVRGDRSLEVELTVADRSKVGVGVDDVPEEAVAWAGMWIADDADGTYRAALGVPDGRSPLVVRVDPDSPAARLGVLAGDRLAQVGPRPVRSLDELSQRMLEATLGAAVVHLERSGNSVIAVLPAP